MIRLVSCKKVDACLVAVLESEAGSRVFVRMDPQKVGAAFVSNDGAASEFAKALVDKMNELSAVPGPPVIDVVETKAVRR